MEKKISLKSVIKIFNEKKRDIFWEKNEVEWKKKFKEALEITEFSIKKKHSNKRIKIIQRLILGYSGFCSQSGLFSGIYSEKAKAVSKTSKEITADHVFGATMIGEEIIKKFKSKKFDINYMTNTWLYENLFLWMTIKITKLEHNKLSKDNTFDEKKAMKHYQDAKIFNIYYKD